MKKELLKEIKGINFELVTSLYDSTKKEKKNTKDEITPIDYLDKFKLGDKYKYYENIGKKAIKEGELAVVTMAGGQGTRLGHNGPKGTFKLDVYGKGKYLFEILVDNLKEANQKYGITINWYIMTSKENNSATVEFLEKNNYFGYDKKYVTIFTQSELPLIDEQGKLLIGKDLKIKEDENSGVRWVNIEDVEKVVTEKWVAENVYRKLNEKLKNIKEA